MQTGSKHQNFLDHGKGILKYLSLFFLMAVLSACGSVTAVPTHTPAAVLTAAPAPTQSPTHRQSATSLPTPSPTIRPTATATIEPTWTPFPTSTLLVPTPVTGNGYQLTTWTPDKAVQLIETLKNYPETLHLRDRGYLDSGYYVAFQYAGLAELESALRFPQAQQAKTWQYDGAYNQFQSSSEDITRLYAGLIANALNQKETTLQDFETWFAKTIPFRLNMYETKPPKGYQQSIILYLYKDSYLFDDEYAGGFAIWILQKGGTFSSYPLENAWEIAYGDGDSTVEVADLSGDGITEVIIQNIDWGSNGMHAGEMAMYRLDQVPPQKISFDAPPPDPSIANWSVDQSKPVPTITFQVRVSTTSDMPCGSFSAGWQYQWKNDGLKFTGFVPPPMEEMEQAPPCTRLMINSLGSADYLKNSTALETYKQLLDLPFIAKLDWFGEPRLIEDERFNLARFLTNIGDDAGAAEQIQMINASTEPSVMEWREQAPAYLAARNEPQALLQLCLTYEKCFVQWAEKFTLVPSSRFSEIETLYPQMGIHFHLSGSYDFDQDGQTEKWLLFRTSTGCGNSFYILAKNNDRIYSRKAADLCLPNEVQEDEKINIRPLASIGGLPAYEVFVVGQEQDAEKFLYWPMDQPDPTINSRRARQMINVIQNQMVLGQISPAEAQIRLKNFQNLPLQPDYESPFIQAQLLYLLGLTQELNGERAQAARTYLELWQTYPHNPYAIMAYAKLEATQ